MAKKQTIPAGDTPADPKEAPETPQEGKNAASSAKSSASELEGRLASAEEKMAQAERKLDEMKDVLMRTAAEYENYRKRSQKEQETSFSGGIGHAACELLPVLDTLEAAAGAATTDEEYKKGVVLTLAKCTEVFGRLGIHEIEALGEPFDPELHNAVMQDPVEGVESGTITQVMQKGYTLNGRVIRHSMVAVAP